MTTETRCPDSVTRETLSAWRDGALPDSAAARIQAHTLTCRACQSAIQSYQRVGQLVSGQPIPTSSAVDVASIRAARSATRAAPGKATRRRMPRAVWGGVGAVLAAAVLIAAFAQVFGRLSHTPGAAATATATPRPITTLVWSKRTLPAGLTLNPDVAGAASDKYLVYRQNFAFSPASSQDGWICDAAPDGVTTVWATTDQARTWRKVGSIARPAVSSMGYVCSIYPDQLNPTTVAIEVDWQGPFNGQKPATYGASYLSRNGGESWTSLGKIMIGDVVTLGTNTYITTYDVGANVHALEVSSDGFHTKRDISPTGSTSGPMSLSADASTNKLMLGGGDNTEILWRSTDGGITWSKTPIAPNPQRLFPMSLGEYWLPAAHVWRLCEFGSGQIDCTRDYGQTWTAMGALKTNAQCANCDLSFTDMQSACGFSLPTAQDGSAITLCLPAGTYTASNLPAPTAYRSADNGKTWKAIGQVPGTWYVPNQNYANWIATADDPAYPAGVLWFADEQTNTLYVAPVPNH